MDGCGGRDGSLERALEALADVVVAPTQFTTSRVEKERQAILSEARIINTLEYRKNCATVEALHSETRLSRRFPIGDLDKLERYSVQDLVDYHRIHYRPSNLRLFLVGDIAPKSAIQAIERVFAGMQEDKELVDQYMRVHADIYSGTVKESRWGLPPAKHIWDQPGPIAHVWQNGQIKNLSLEVVRKMPIPTILTRGDMRQSLLMKLAYRILSLNFDILQRGTGSLEAVEANDYDCTNEGCRVRSFEMRCAPFQWREALTAAVAQAKCLATQGATHEMFSIVKDSMLLDCSRLDTSKADNRDVITGLMDAATCGRTVMLPDTEKEIVTEMLNSVHLDDVNDMAYRLFPWSSGESFSGIHLICSTPPPDPSIGYDGVTEELIADAFDSECREPLSAASLNPNVNTPSQLLSDEERREVVGRRPYGEEPAFVTNPMLPKEQYARPEQSREEVLRSLAVGGDLRLVSERYIDALRDSFKLHSDIEYITENKETPSELSRIGERLVEGSRHLVNEQEHGKYTQALANLRKPLASTLDPSDVLYRERPGPAGIHLLTLGNSIRVNLRVGEGDQMAIKAIIPIEYDYCDQEALLRRKRDLLLAANAMMEGGAMGSLSRLQVEMFCSQHLIDVMIGSNEDYFSIEMSFPYGRQGRRGGNLESALQIMHSLLQNHRIEPDALERAKDKLRRDRDVYAQDLQAYGTADLVSAMSEGKLTYHNLDMAAIGESKLEDIQATLDGIFKRGAVELSMSGAFDLQAAKSLLLQYIGTVQLPEASSAAPDRYQLWRYYDSVNDNMEDKGARFTTLQEEAAGSTQTGESGSEAADEPTSPEDRHRLILVPDNQERAMVLVGGYAPNASGIMPDGTHMADIMHAELYAALATDKDVNNNVEKLVRTAKELWLHPAFPRAACALLQEILSNRSFTVLRAEKHLTYESNVDFVLYDVQFAGYFVISVHSSFDKSESILEETRNLVAELRSGIRPVTEHHLQRARDQVIARLRKDRTANRHWVGELLGTQSRRMPLKSSLFCTEFERVLRRITLDDVHLMFGSNAFGFDEERLWSRIVHTAVG
ncbi:peptidase M16 inactive domain-containing protein [Babesia ovata]|uniref:Peptidase M16 inactive domain-containing protein n=1 Tax=Babesia ovata TaxID=189622 RepID=A0A2H6KFT0_9APIC|nr:peptidase M16 inactive domain-containing protein [Babesia ovata]GBE61852.1 peptidase M16 inactive domain-containing protein [Babesia ovata]